MKLQVESEVVVFALDSTRQRLPTARAADRSAHSAWPGHHLWAMSDEQLARSDEKCTTDDEQWVMDKRTLYIQK